MRRSPPSTPTPGRCSRSRTRPPGPAPRAPRSPRCRALGTAAFTATQVYQVGGAITDVATTIIRYHNVLITVVLNGLDQSNRGGYGPVSISQLSAGSLAVARAAFAQLHT